MSALPSCDRCVLDAHAAMAPEFDAHCRVPVLCDSSCNLRAILNSYGTTKPVNAMLSLAIVHHRCMSSLIAPLFPQVRHLGHLDGRRHGVRDVGGHYRVRCCAAFTRIHAIAKNHTLFHTLLHTVTTRFRCSLPRYYYVILQQLRNLCGNHVVRHLWNQLWHFSGNAHWRNELRGKSAPFALLLFGCPSASASFCSPFPNSH